MCLKLLKCFNNPCIYALRYAYGVIVKDKVVKDRVDKDNILMDLDFKTITPVKCVKYKHNSFTLGMQNKIISK